MWICFGFVIYMALTVFLFFLSFIQYFWPFTSSPLVFSNILLSSLRAHSFGFGNGKHVWLASIYTPVRFEPTEQVLLSLMIAAHNCNSK